MKLLAGQFEGARGAAATAARDSGAGQLWLRSTKERPCLIAYVYATTPAPRRVPSVRRPALSPAASRPQAAPPPYISRPVVPGAAVRGNGCDAIDWLPEGLRPHPSNSSGRCPMNRTLERHSRIPPKFLSDPTNSRDTS